MRIGHNSRRTKTQVLLLILLQPLFALGNADLLPAITPTTINGVWESSLEKAGGVWRMDVNTNGDSYLASVGPPNGFYHSIYRLRSWNIKNGDLRLRFSNISDKTDATKELIIEGKGVAGSESGVIEAKITFKTNFPTPNPSTQITLIKGSWVQTMAALSKQAQDLIAKEKDKKQ